MSTSKIGKHLMDSFLGSRINQPKYNEKFQVTTHDYLIRYARPEMQIAEPKFGRGKRIKVWSNGEAHCYEFNINPKDFRSWTSILLHITNCIKPGFGAVRKLVALSSLTFVGCFEELDINERYVALGATCKFKMAPGGYRTSSEKELYKREKVAKRFYTGEMNSKVLPFLLETEKKKLTIIYMTVNGRSYQPPQKIVLNSNDMRNWVLIIKYLTKILDMPDGIAGICTIFGDIIKDPSELQHGYLYVAVPFKEHFIPMDYMSLFEDHHSKYRSSYTLTIRPAPPHPDKLYSAIRKMKKRLSNVDFFGDTKLPARPNTPIQTKRNSRISMTRERSYDCSREVKTGVKKEFKVLPTRCDSQPTGQVSSTKQLEARCDSQPGGQVTSIIHQELANPMKAYENTVADIEKRFSIENEQVTSSTEYQLESGSTSTSNQTSFAALAAFSNKNLKTTWEAQQETSESPPSYTIVNSSRIVPCNLMTVMDTQLRINGNMVTVGSREYFRRNPNGDVFVKEDCSNGADLKGQSGNEVNQIELPAVQESTAINKNLRDSPKSPNGRNTPTIHIRNRTDISIFNINSTSKTTSNKNNETSCDFSDFETISKNNNQSDCKSENRSAASKNQLDELNDESKQKNGLDYRRSIHKITESYKHVTPTYGARQKIKSKTFTLNSSMPKKNVIKTFSSMFKLKTEESACIENSDATDTDMYLTISEEEISQASSNTKPFISEKSDNRVNNTACERGIESTVSHQFDVDYKVKENILEIKDVRKSLQKRIGIGSFRVSTPEVENCLRYSLGDGKYIQEDICSISSDSIESKLSLSSESFLEDIIKTFGRNHSLQAKKLLLGLSLL